MKYYKILLIAIVFSSCDVSTLSKSEVLGLEQLKATIHINHDTNKVNYLRVKLSDGKKQIINKNIHVLLNNKPLGLYVKDELYYTKTSYYTADDLAKADSYYFEIILPNSIKHPLAFIKPKKEVAKFSMPDSLTAKNDFVFKWERLNNPHQIEIIKGNKTNSQATKNRIIYGYSVKPIDTLKKNEGKYVVPKSYFTDSSPSIKHFDVILYRKEKGLMNPNLLKNSDVTYHHIIEKTIVIK